MKHLMLICFIIALAVQAQAQSHLAIDLYRLGHFKRLHIYPGEKITYKLKGSHRYQEEVFTGGRDSTIYLANGDEIRFSEIKTIRIDRSNWLVRKLYRLGIQGGIFIVAIDAANNIGNNRPTVVDPPFIYIGSGMVATGLIIKYLLCRQRLHPGENTRLQLLNLNPK